ncbi:MAG: hypothetical protein KatS3mg054_0977 [Chloroflexus sp.]|nr:MAG: hypothetical protein KatS3mg054_0977 [Chloroflexus sp.]
MDYVIIHEACWVADRGARFYPVHRQFPPEVCIYYPKHGSGVIDLTQGIVAVRPADAFVAQLTLASAVNSAMNTHTLVSPESLVYGVGQSR